MRIDSHQHFWKFEPDQYRWIGPDMQLLARDWLYADLEGELVRAELDGCIAVQARQSLEENRFLLNIANQCERVRGVVGWVDLCAEDVEEQLAVACGRSACSRAYATSSRTSPMTISCCATTSRTASPGSPNSISPTTS